MFGASDFNKLAAHVDAFSLMTYDFSQPGRYVLCDRVHANMCACTVYV